MPGVTAPFPNIFDPANLLGTTGASNTKIRYRNPSVSRYDGLKVDKIEHVRNDGARWGL